LVTHRTIIPAGTAVEHGDAALSRGRKEVFLGHSRVNRVVDLHEIEIAGLDPSRELREVWNFVMSHTEIADPPFLFPGG